MERVQIPPSALLVATARTNDRRELLVWVDAAFRHVLPTLPKKVCGMHVKADILPVLSARVPQEAESR